MPDKTKKVNLTESLAELNEIVDWFDGRESVDVEVGLAKVKKAATLIKASKSRLAEVENEFREIEKEIGEDVDDEEEAEQTEAPIAEVNTGEDINPKDIPF